MTDLAVIVRSLERRGVTLRVAGTQIQVSPPGSLTEPERAHLKQLSHELTEYLNRPTIGETEAWLGRLDPGASDAGSEPTAPCWPCGTVRFWRRLDGPWICTRCHPPPVPDDHELGFTTIDSIPADLRRERRDHA